MERVEEVVAVYIEQAEEGSRVHGAGGLLVSAGAGVSAFNFSIVFFLFRRQIKATKVQDGLHRP